MTPLYGHDEAVSRFVASTIEGCGRGFGKCKTIGVLDDKGRLVAGLVYHNWNPEAGVIEISGSALNRRWLTRPILREMFAYPFERVLAQLVVMRVSARDGQQHLHRMLHAYGFKSFRIPRLRGRDEDEMLFTLTDDAWRANKFMRKANGQA